MQKHRILVIAILAFTCITVTIAFIVASGNGPHRVAASESQAAPVLRISAGKRRAKVLTPRAAKDRATKGNTKMARLIGGLY